MIETQVICDFCEKPLPKDGNDVMLHYTKEMNTRLMFPHLCEKCAGKIDMILAEYKLQAYKQRRICGLNAVVNAERREKLGTNG